MKNKILLVLVFLMLFVAGGTTYYAYSVYRSDTNEKVINIELENSNLTNYTEEQLQVLKSTEESLKSHFNEGKYIYAIEHYKNVFADSSLMIEPNDEILSIYNKVVYTYFDSIDKFNEDIFLRVQEKSLNQETTKFLNSKFGKEIILSKENNKNQQTEFDKKQEKERNQREIEKRAKEGVRIGMTTEEVLMSNWGSPKDINKTTTAYGTSEQWVYPNYNYLYFEDGILVTIQN